MTPITLTTIEAILRRLHREVGGHPTLELRLSDERVDWTGLSEHPSRLPLPGGGTLCAQWIPESDSVRLRLEHFDRGSDPIGHLALDTAAPIGAALGALIGGMLWRRGGMLAGALIGGAAASKTPARSQGLWAISSWSAGGAWEVSPVVRSIHTTVAA